MRVAGVHGVLRRSQKSERSHPAWYQPSILRALLRAARRARAANIARVPPGRVLPGNPTVKCRRGGRVFLGNPMVTRGLALVHAWQRLAQRRAPVGIAKGCAASVAKHLPLLLPSNNMTAQ